MEIIEKYGIKLMPVEIEDARLIIDMRTDDRKSRYISHTNSDIEEQIKWINSYKKRELERKEYYFIAVDDQDNKFSTYRIYNIEEDTAEIGSWVTKPGYKYPQNSIKVDLIMKEFVFEVLGFNQLKFEVRRKNTSVLKYHKIFNPLVVRETEEDVFFSLEKENYYKIRNSLFKNIK
ncbi:GNAT family N-acetyltransferase [Elizabethkingia ursingii]|nr:GNAT family N-acetyltransferase [Elizabethkingia ursingii]MDR2229241.1 GNAT family N-acetyltransferase [Flavobacteriaceae bacterium]